MTHAAPALELLSHPDTRIGAVWRITARAQLTDAVTLACHFQLQGDMEQLRIPHAHAGHRADGLWQHTCCEIFLAPEGADSYFEFNFSPAMDWAAYRFDSWRAGMQPASLTQAPGLNVHRDAAHLDVSATVHLAGLAECARARSLRVALTAVVEDADGTLGYWALRHPPGNPDFHHPAGFIHAVSLKS
ncbi:MAG: DOMON-like domain-containing protein [Proteobacteria bacterium]|nr:DOMON-like domain-containing protein [Pseudomonadota bacterium]